MRPFYDPILWFNRVMFPINAVPIRVHLLTKYVGLSTADRSHREIGLLAFVRY